MNYVVFFAILCLGGLGIVLLYLYKSRDIKKMISVGNQLLLDILSTVTTQESIHDGARSMVNSLKKFYNMDYCTIFLYEQDIDLLKSIYSTARQSHLNLLEAYINKLFKAKRDISDADILYSQSFLQYPTASDREIRYSYFMPLRLKKAIVGALLIENRENIAIEKYEHEFLKIMGSSISIALQNFTYLQKTKLTAVTDGLMLIYNKKYMDDFLDEQLTLNIKFNIGFCIVMVDIDHFKSFNDVHGHVFGDKVLKEVATFLKSKLREGDTIARYGGEEILIYMPKINIDKAFERMDYIRQGLSVYELRKDDGTIVNVTASFGISEFPGDGTTKKDLLIKVDKALYFAKEHGRNMVSYTKTILQENK